MLGIVFIVVFSGYLIASITNNEHGVGSVFSMSGFLGSEAVHSTAAGLHSVLGACAILCLMFLGFDGITTFAEETRDPRQQISKAIILTCVIAGVVFVAVAYLMQLAWPAAWREMQNPDIAATELILRMAGPAMNVVFTVIMVTGFIGAGLSALSGGARILYSMGRDGVLPSPLGGLHPRLQTPVNAILLISAIGVLSLFSSLLNISSIVNFGALVAFMAVNVCVIVQYRFRKKASGARAVLLYTALPLAGFIVDFMIWISLDKTAKVIGVAWTIVGFVILLIRTRGFRKPMKVLTDGAHTSETVPASTVA